MRPYVIALASLAVPIAAGAQADTNFVPRELATALVSTTDYSSSRARIVVGTFPTPEMAGMVPRGGRVLGGLVHEDRRGKANRFTGILAYRESPDSIATLLEQQVGRVGLRSPAMEGLYAPGGGFLPAGSDAVGRERPLMFCGDSVSVTAMVNEYASGSLLRLTTSGSTQNTICDMRRNAELRVTAMSRAERIVLPTLRPPAGATGNPSGRSSSSSSSGELSRQGSSAWYAARQTAAEMVDHFARQLTEQGWTLGKRIAEDSVALLVARKTEKGEVLHLLLTDHITNARDHALEVSVMAPNRRP
jgi:hypothetical protein